MALKIYKYRGFTYQFDENDVPDGAVLIETKSAPKPANKARRAPQNKAKG